LAFRLALSLRIDFNSFILHCLVFKDQFRRHSVTTFIYYQINLKLSTAILLTILNYT